VIDLNTLYNGCTRFLADYTQEEEVDSSVVDLLVDAARSYFDKLDQGDDYWAEMALETSSTYVQCDLSSDDLEEYVEMFQNYLWMASEGEFDQAA
jgi:hypothetical protein